VEFVLCLVVSLPTLDPISLGTILYLNVVLGTMEKHWMLDSFIRKMVLPLNFESQARMIDEFLSISSHQCYLGNKYLTHAYISSFQPCVGYSWHEIIYFQTLWFLQSSLRKHLYCQCVYVEMIAYNGEYIKSCSWFTNPKYVNLASFLHIISSTSSHVQYRWICKVYLHWYLLPFSNYHIYLLFP